MVSVFQPSGNFNSDFKPEILILFKKYVHGRGAIKLDESKPIENSTIEYTEGWHSSV